MRWLKTIARELAGLFVDDGRLALGIGAWLLAGWLLLPRLALPPAWHGIILVSGFLLILVESALRRAGAAAGR